jgi:sulfoxide reductase heme-binding subunit YedZ
VAGGGDSAGAAPTPGRSPKKRRERVAKALVGAAGLSKLPWLAWGATHGLLGANPIAEALNELGLWTLILLLTSLACTPIHVVSGWSFPLRLRKLLGLEAFFFACLHFFVYVGLDQGFDWPGIWQDIVKRGFMTIGFLALVLLLPLALTSTKGMVRRLGFPRWKRLHRLVYLAAALGVVHFLWRVKSDLRVPLAYAFVLGVLMAIRVFDHYWTRGARDPERHRAP